MTATTHPDINDPNAFVFYRYTPSIPAAIIFIILFLASTGMHMFQAYRKRTFYFIPLIIGGFFEWIGYVGRAMGHSNPWNLGPYIMQELLTLLAPALFAASIYMVLGRMITFVDGEHLAPIRVSRLTKIFVAGDVFSFLVQSSGGGLMASAGSMNMGKNLVVAGLCIQIIFFGLFVFSSLLFHVRINRNPTVASEAVAWKKYIYALYASSVLILIRSIFRVALFADGNDSVLARNEAFVYIFDALFMLAVLVIFNVVHPGQIIGRKKNRDAEEVHSQNSNNVTREEITMETK
ncbi:RTA-like protein [Coleophoma cylindrospora]|uniref:RTA-like protein n=1 Tax=Coleophoma cylindrospora TaxID=1849047 RepID=A0A3D8QT85_9HELO|nr:RTA-like protein [Coleophoma cylindrospora]